MEKYIDICLRPQEAADIETVKKAAAACAGLPVGWGGFAAICRRSIDARKRDIKVNLRVLLSDSAAEPDPQAGFNYLDVHSSPEAVIAGAGPAGLFAALRMLELGIKPIILERGKDVSSRKRDIASMYRTGSIGPESNYCFGEGGAGTFSDGKLYTRSKKRGDIERVLRQLVMHGASSDILVDAHPHIGSNKLPAIIAAIRNRIIEHGGQVLFNEKLSHIGVESGRIAYASTVSGLKISCRSLILATGHSASDIYRMLHHAGISIEAKPFAMGVRIEHPQEIIDRIQYHNSPDIKYLPAASYSLVHQAAGRGVYSFCMCPGGIIVPSGCADGQGVVNGMSSSSRNSPFANSGIAVEIRLEDMKEYAEHGPLAGLAMQENLEQLAWRNGGRGLNAPGQRMADFVKGTISQDLPGMSYIPGAVSSPLHFWMPDHISLRLRESFSAFGKKMRGYFTNHAVIFGAESRTSSPVRVPRNPESLQHPHVKGLYPCGEGAGYAGGIVSAAMDGIACAEKLAQAKELS
jgi:uncharacterized protein